MYTAVTYDQHMWALIKFQDWRKLYDPRLIERYDTQESV